MADTISTSSLSYTAARGRALSATMAAAIWRHRYLHAMALIGLGLGIAVGRVTGNLPDFGALEEYAGDLGIAFWIAGCVYALYRFVQLAFFERDPAPLHTFLASFASFLCDRERLANGVNGFLAVVLFVSGFGVLKGAIAILAPFKWDMALFHADRFLHFGHDPYALLGWVTRSPAMLHGLNFAYNFWFFLLIGLTFAAAITRRDTVLRHQFLMSFMLIWLAAGFFLAMGFSSAGPCYFARLGLGDQYQSLMDALAAVDKTRHLWALSTQDMLWDGYTGATSGSIGISAFPSMHVANAVLFALYATRRWSFVGIFFWLFAAVIMVGSVAFGWHYAVDGYAGALIAVAVWKMIGWWLVRSAPAGVEAA